MTSPETNSTPSAEFEAGSFTITHLSDNPDGFEFATKENIGRTASLTGDERLRLNSDQRERLKGAVGREMTFNGAEIITEARRLWKEAEAAGDMATADHWRQEYLEARNGYIGRGKKIGFRAIELSGSNTLTADVQLVPFQVYTVLSTPEMSPEVEKLSAASGVAMVVETSDGKLVIQHRGVKKQKVTEPGMSRGNATYADIPGASVAGMVDASLGMDGDRQPGTPDNVTTDTLKQGILKEAGEELGLAPDDIKGLRIVGLAKDHYKPHDEVLFLATLAVTADELRETSRLSNRNKNLADADFEEKFLTVDGSPEAIETFLTEVKCPLPPTHAAAMVAAGYSSVLREEGQAAAHAWRERMQAEVRRNYQEINDMVRAYYQRYPEVLEQVPERYWNQTPPARNTDGYSPAYTPEEQGLPAFEDEMVRTGLIPETRRHAEEGDLFDVDGVVTDPKEKKVTDSAIYDEHIARLRTGDPICYNTGRSTGWVMERVVGPMIERMGDDTSALSNLLIVGEKGGTWGTFGEDGKLRFDAVATITVPDDLKDRVRGLIAEKYADVMFFDESKQTMISVEMVDGYDVGAFAERQTQLIEDLRIILAETGTDEAYRIDPTTIATDIESPYVGKALGSDRFLEFLKSRGIVVESFKAFGDSASDAAMADELARRGRMVEFVYVGDKPESVNRRADYPVEEVAGFSNGTLEYLRR